MAAVEVGVPAAQELGNGPDCMLMSCRFSLRLGAGSLTGGLEEGTAAGIGAVVVGAD